MIKPYQTRQDFLARAKYAQSAAYFGLETDEVIFVASRHEGDSRSGEWDRRFYLLRGGKVVKRLTSKGFAQATPSETEEVIRLARQ